MYSFGLDHETWSKGFTEQREEIPHFIVSAQLTIWNTTSQPPLYLFFFFFKQNWEAFKSKHSNLVTSAARTELENQIQTQFLSVNVAFVIFIFFGGFR